MRAFALLGVVATASITGVWVPNGPAMAAGLNLICKEVRGTEEKEYGHQRGMSEEETTRNTSEIEERWSIPVHVNTKEGSGSVWGKPYELSVEPEVISLRHREEKEGQMESETKYVALKVDRRSLAFTYFSRNMWRRRSSLGLSMRSERTRKSEGVCEKVVELKGNQI